MPMCGKLTLYGGNCMPKTMGGKLKLLRLRDILLENTDENNCMSVPQIIDALAVYGISAERKSIYNDLECLEQYGMDIIRMPSGYCVGKRDFELSELKILVDVIQASRFLTAKKSISLINKIMKLAPKREAETLLRSVVISGRVKAPNEKIYYNVDVIQNAIRLSKKVRFKYCSYAKGFEIEFKRDGADYVVSPVALMWNDENYYLVAYDDESGMLKHYRVDKMEYAEQTDIPRTVCREITEFDRAEYAKKTFDMFGGDECGVVLSIDKDSLGIFADFFGTDSILIDDGERYHASVTVAMSGHFYSWIFGLNGKIKIKGPESVKDGYVRYCSEMLTKGITN